jgi:CRP-like cAMP-binding protein
MQFISQNELLTALPPVIYERLGPHLQRVRLEAGGVLFDVGATIDYTWFITSGIVSLLGVTEDGTYIEVAMAGCHSVIGFPGIVRKNETAFRAQVQVAGEALRVSARDLQAAIKQESQIAHVARHNHLDLSQHDRHSGALPEIRRNGGSCQNERFPRESELATRA